MVYSEIMKKQIWYIDKDERILEVVKTEFPKIAPKFDVKTINNPIVIDELLKEKLPEVIFIDSGIGLQDEASIIRDFKHADETKDIPIILLGGDVRLEDTAKEVGADDFLKKPFDMRQLLEKVK
jgi:DNA-binding response OmpR family regulator